MDADNSLRFVGMVTFFISFIVLALIALRNDKTASIWLFLSIISLLLYFNQNFLGIVKRLAGLI